MFAAVRKPANSFQIYPFDFHFINPGRYDKKHIFTKYLLKTALGTEGKLSDNGPFKPGIQEYFFVIYSKFQKVLDQSFSGSAVFNLSCADVYDFARHC
ncbi:hypothetical protein [Nitrosomonas eutropha]|uniref:hypothetical protein n=1 Tax=Nitrosomonas eutropha TaxID=916 RepID=UPI00210BE9FF|nr:hypothetical protein [Nitrosomonas eutropha]